MATNDERLAVAIEANTKQFENAIRALEKKIDGSFKNSAKSTKQLGTALASLVIL